MRTRRSNENDSLLVVLVVLILALFAHIIAAEKPIPLQYSIDLKTLGYPEPPCDYMFPEDSYTKRHVDFLDSERLLVSFPAETTGCKQAQKEQGYFLPTRFRSVVIDFSGKVLHSFDWHRGEDVQAGPDARILFSSGREVRLLGADFSLLQSIPDPREPPRTMGGLNIDPARIGFLIADHGHVIYFSGTPAKPGLEADDCHSVIAVQGGFVCRVSAHPDRFTAHVVPNQPQPDLRSISAVLQPGMDDNPDRRWVVPGWPAWISREGRSMSPSGRLMYFSTGTLFPVTDTSGLGYFLRVVVVDARTNRTILREQYDIEDDVALSPDGQWFAVREGTRMTVRRM